MNSTESKFIFITANTGRPICMQFTESMKSLIEIESFKIYAGNLPARKLKPVQAWLKENSEWALEVFYQLNEHLR